MTQEDFFSLSQAAMRSPEALAVITDEGSFSFGEMAAKMKAFSEAMGLSLGAAKFDALPIRAHNSLPTLLALYSVMESQGSVIALHPRLNDRETAALLTQFQSPQCLTDEHLNRLALQAHAQGTSILRNTSLSSAESPFAYLFTSGTSGQPKAAILSRRAFISSARASEHNLQWDPDDRWLLCLPVCHVGGLSVVTRCLLAQKPLRLLPSFDADRVLEAIVRDRCTLLSVVPTMLHRLLLADKANILATLRVLLVGGAATPVALVDECAARNISLRATYGMTEATSQITTQRERPRGLAEYGCGRVLDGAELAIINESGELCQVDEVGRIQVRGPMLFSGYVNHRPHEPTEWFDTHDLGAINSLGNLQLFSRKNELIITGGENVYPLEVERELERCSGIKAALVFAVDDLEWGHKVVCALVIDQYFSAERFRDECRALLASHKRPRAYVVVESLPTNAASKLDRTLAARVLSDKLQPI